MISTMMMMMMMVMTMTVMMMMMVVLLMRCQRVAQPVEATPVDGNASLGQSN